LTIANTAFEVVAERLYERRKDLARIARTGYSFEEWVTCEAYLACSKKWHEVGVSPRPHYRSVSSGRNGFGDLLVSRKLDSVLIEIGIVHKTTGSKWDQKVENDMSKLASISGAQALQFLMFVTEESKRPAALKELRDRMPRRFKAGPSLQDSINLKEQTAHLFGWTSHDLEA
jgi:hypothetical protein